MSRALATDSLSMTGGGAALLTDASGSIEPSAIAGLFVGDVRVLSEWRLDTRATLARLQALEAKHSRRGHR